MDLGAYQKAAATTSKLPLSGPAGPIAPMLGLAGETGSILNVYKRYLRDGIDLEVSHEFLKEELGDLLWYTAAVATACHLDLEEIAVANLVKAKDLYGDDSSDGRSESLPSFDDGYPATQRFPRRLIVRFDEMGGEERLRAELTLVEAAPNAFPNGPERVGEKEFGFTVGARLGATLTDNTRHPDAYRFHDAIHLGFVAVLGWSPTIRSLLRIKRKANQSTDENEDGARAVYAEEGLAAILSRLAPKRTGFMSEVSVDGDAIDVVKAAVADLEVDRLPGWLWRKAISQGFSVLHHLEANHGGFVIADLDHRVLSYAKTI